MEKYVIIRLVLGLVLAGFTPAFAAENSVILIIGDGMGLTAQQMLRLIDGPLAIDTMADSAIVLTASESDAVTDSAAGATAMASGVKTQNGSVGVDAKGARVVSVAELAQKAGKQIGILTTSYLWDATPAAFYAHVESRRSLDTIIKHALAMKPDLLMGGGEENLLPEDTKGRYGESERDDAVNFVHAFQKAGYAVGYDAHIPRLPYLGILAGKALYEERPPHYAPEVSLPAMTQAALKALKGSPKGFLLVVEDEGIDEMAHLNAIAPLLTALRHWNATVAVALAYQRSHPGTVVIVTSDHETGNMDLASTRECRGKPHYSLTEKAFCVAFSTRGHGGMPVAVYTSGLEIDQAVIENTAIFDAVKRGLGLP